MKFCICFLLRLALHQLAIAFSCLASLGYGLRTQRQNGVVRREVLRNQGTAALLNHIANSSPFDPLKLAALLRTRQTAAAFGPCFFSCGRALQFYSGLPAAPKPIVQMIEKRFDIDGISYTRREFQEVYKGQWQEMWDASEPDLAESPAAISFAFEPSAEVTEERSSLVQKELQKFDEHQSSELDIVAAAAPDEAAPLASASSVVAEPASRGSVLGRGRGGRGRGRLLCGDVSNTHDRSVEAAVDAPAAPPASAAPAPKDEVTVSMHDTLVGAAVDAPAAPVSAESPAPAPAAPPAREDEVSVRPSVSDTPVEAAVDAPAAPVSAESPARAPAAPARRDEVTVRPSVSDFGTIAHKNNVAPSVSAESPAPAPSPPGRNDEVTTRPSISYFGTTSQKKDEAAVDAPAASVSAESPAPAPAAPARRDKVAARPYVSYFGTLAQKKGIPKTQVASSTVVAGENRVTPLSEPKIGSSDTPQMDPDEKINHIKNVFDEFFEVSTVMDHDIAGSARSSIGDPINPSDIVGSQQELSSFNPFDDEGRTKDEVTGNGNDKSLQIGANHRHHHEKSEQSSIDEMMPISFAEPSFGRTAGGGDAAASSVESSPEELVRRAWLLEWAEVQQAWLPSRQEQVPSTELPAAPRTAKRPRRAPPGEFDDFSGNGEQLDPADALLVRYLKNVRQPNHRRPRQKGKRPPRWINGIKKS